MVLNVLPAREEVSNATVLMSGMLMIWASLLDAPLSREVGPQQESNRLGGFEGTRELEFSSSPYRWIKTGQNLEDGRQGFKRQDLVIPELALRTAPTFSLPFRYLKTKPGVNRTGADLFCCRGDESLADQLLVQCVHWEFRSCVLLFL